MTEDTSTMIYYLLYGFAFLASMLAFAMTSMQKLRLLIVLSSLAYAVYYYFFPAEPLWLDVGSEMALVFINGFMLIYLLWSNSRIKFDQQEQLLYDNEFSGLTRIEYNQLLKISEWELEKSGYVYTTIGKALDNIYYIVSGRAEARLADGNAATIKEGRVRREMITEGAQSYIARSRRFRDELRRLD